MLDPFVKPLKFIFLVPRLSFLDQNCPDFIFLPHTQEYQLRNLIFFGLLILFLLQIWTTLLNFDIVLKTFLLNLQTDSSYFLEKLVSFTFLFMLIILSDFLKWLIGKNIYNKASRK